MYSSKNSVVSGRKVEGRAQGPLILGKKEEHDIEFMETSGFGDLGKNPSPRWDLNPRPYVI